MSSAGTEIVLYQYGGVGRVPSFSPPCLKVRLALLRLGLPHRVVDLAGPLQVKRQSPTGRVPALDLDGARIADSVFIVDRLEARHPQAPLWPADTAQHSVDRLWDCFATDTLYWQGFYLRWLVPATRQRVLDARYGPGLSFQKLIMTTLAPCLLRARARGQGIGGRAQQDVEASFATSLDMILAGLGRGPFLQSRSEPGRGDLAIAAHLAQFTVGRTDDEIARLPAIVLRLLDHCDATFRACGLEPVRSPPA